eukprot:COSAG02_NODE_1249_length_13624_cov_4.621600_5_plen_522_part_00
MRTLVPLPLPLLLLLLLLFQSIVGDPPWASAAKRGKRQRLKDGDRAPCACQPAGYVVDAAERACAKGGQEDMFELCTADELAAAPPTADEEETEGSSGPSPPSDSERKAEASKQTMLSPRERAEKVADHVVAIDDTAQLAGLVTAHTVVLLAVGTATERVPCKPCGVFAPNLKLAAARFNATWGRDSYATHGSAVFAATASDSTVGQALAIHPGITTLPTLFLYADGGAPPIDRAAAQQVAASSGKPHKRSAVYAASELPGPRQRLDKYHRRVIWNEAGLSGYIVDELTLAESRQMMATAAEGAVDAAGVHDPETLATPIRNHADLEALRASHTLVLVKAVKSGCKHCEHLAPHFGAAAAACNAAFAARGAAQQEGGKIAFAVAQDSAAINLFNVKSYPTMLLFVANSNGRPVLTMTRADPLVEWRGATLASFLEEQLARVVAGLDVQKPSKANAENVDKDGEAAEAPGCCDRGAAETDIKVTLPSGLASSNDDDVEEEEDEEDGDGDGEESRSAIVKDGL